MKIIKKTEDWFSQWFKTLLWIDHTPSCTAVSYKLRILVTYAEYFAIGKFWKRGAMYIEGNIESRSGNKFYLKKGILTSIELFCVFLALIIGHAKRICRILLSSKLPHCTIYFSQCTIYFLPFFINGKDLWKELLSIKCAYGFHLLHSPEMFLILRSNQRNNLINMHSSIKKIAIILVIF